MLLAATVAVPTFAGYTDIYQPTTAGEKNHAGILGDIYDGGTPFTGGGGPLNYDMWTEYSSSDDMVTAYRIDDFNEGEIFALDLVTGEVGEVVDQIWTDGISTVTAEAKYADLSQSFGWNQGDGVDGLETNYYELLTDANIGNGPVEIEITGDFLWGIQPNGLEWWSLTSENEEIDPIDHMVTYKIEGVSYGNEVVWMVFWEDLPAGHSSFDGDYNDFAVEIRAVPEPATIFLLGISGVLMTLTRKRRSV